MCTNVCSMDWFQEYRFQTLSMNYSTIPPQFIVVPEERALRGRTRSSPIRSKPCTEMTGAEFAMNVIGSFDLDICRCCIYNNEYLCCMGGLDTVQTFFNEELLLDLDLEGMIWTGRTWKGMSEGEKHLRRMETKERVKKYVGRL